MSIDSSISLVDNTTSSEPLLHSHHELCRSASSPTATSLAKRFTKESVKDSLARRRYARFQQERYDDEGGGPSRETSLSLRASTELERGPSSSTRSRSAERSSEHNGLLEPASVERISSELPQQQQQEADGVEETSAIDVLYENQRGWWFFGVPLYSAKSLLNLDPSAWLTRDLEVSPVNITNAQVPDPSWEWAWDTWYIDMSYDVDEEGWQYSFAFSSRFAWHGTHPWYHSFARRRRWLRKRVKKCCVRAAVEEGAGQANLLSEDYFVVRSYRAPSTAGGESRRVSREADRSVITGAEDGEVVLPGDITDVDTLLRVLKAAALDRDKIVAVESFVRNGGDDLARLSETMPEILSLLLYQTSRRQLQDYVLQTIKEISPSAEGMEKRKRDCLVKIIDDGRFEGLESWRAERASSTERRREVTALNNEQPQFVPVRAALFESLLMLSGSRHGLRSRVLLPPLDSALATPNEPLHFLFPRCFSSLAQEPLQRLRYPVPARHTHCNSICTWRSPRRLTPLHNASRKCTSSQLARSVSTSCAPKISNSANDEPRPKDGSDPASLDPATSQGPDDCRDVGSSELLSGFEQESSGRSSDTNVDCFPDDGEEIIFTGQKILEQTKRENIRKYWVVAMDETAALSKPRQVASGPAEYHKVIYIPNQTILNLTGQTVENMWYTGVASECRIHVLSKEHVDQQSRRKVILTGSPVAVKFAEQEIARLGKMKAERRILRVSAGMGSRDMRRANEIERPNVWTVRSFANYVDYLTNRPVSNLIHAMIYKKGEEHRVVTRDILVDLFNHPKNRKVLSTRAINLFIFFFSRHRFLPQMRDMFPKIEHLMTARTFNALLTDIASNKDIQAYRMVIRMMSRLNIKPTGTEWVCLLRVIDDPYIRWQIIARMEKDGFLKTELTLQRTIAVIIRDDFREHLQSGKSTQEYISSVDKRYGKAWISSASIDGMLRSASELWNRVAFDDILQHCRENGLKPTTQGMNYYIAGYMHAKENHEGITKFIHISEEFELKPNDETVRQLFHMAWKARGYNMCRVIWRYSCLQSLTGRRMQRLVSTSLGKTKLSETAGPVEAFDLQFGKVAAGIYTKIDRHGPKFNTLVENSPIKHAAHLPVSYLIQPLPDQAGQLQRELANLIIREDLVAFRYYRAEKSLCSMLMDAYKLDKDWERRGVVYGSTVDLVNNAIHVPYMRVYMTKRMKAGDRSK
ncbi:hypothetical protein FQN50_007409 [Emmonsiellopsis sp. PD_5]|nr:hypothetical protein FQN50_007409 [Emmonsiellopsis sp. PD_5]